MGYLPYIFSGFTIIFLVLIAKWLLRQGELRGRTVHETEIGRLKERIAAFEATQVDTRELKLTLQEKSEELNVLQVQNARLQELAKEKSRRVEALEEEEVHRQLYLKGELASGEEKRTAERKSFEMDRSRLSDEVGELRRELAAQSVIVGVHEEHRRQLLEKEEAGKRLSEELQTTRDAYARADELSQSQVLQINELQKLLSASDERVRSAQEALTAACEERGKLQISTEHLEQSVAKARAELSARDTRLAEQQQAFEEGLAERATRAQVQERLDRAENDLAELRSIHSGAQTRVAALDSELTAAQQISEERSRRLATAESDLAAYTNRFNAEHTELTRLKQQSRSQEDQIVELIKAQEIAKGDQAALRDAREEIGKLRAGIHHLEQTVTSVTETLRERDARLAEHQAAFEQTLAEQEKRSQLEQQTARAEKELIDLRDRDRESQTRLATLTSELDAERQQGAHKLRLLTEAKEELSNQFKAVAADILKQNTQQFTDLNQQRLGQLLDSLRSQLLIFQKKVEEVHLEETKQSVDLRGHVDRLFKLNQELSAEARNLTRALKGEAKVQSDWGEMILERVLELAGLTEGLHYSAQQSVHKEEGGYSRPDVVLKLPDNKSLVLDAKVSLKAYEAYTTAESDTQREQHFKLHLDSLRSHINVLAKKNYPALPALNSLPFVVMFVPLEPAYSLAMSRDFSLWQEAWKEGVMLVTPTTLLFVVRIVVHLWQQENQTRNSQEIARHGASLYDKFVAFVEDMDKLGRSLGKAQDSYHAAFNKLNSTRGLIVQAERLRGLGVQPHKKLPAKYATLLDLDDSDEQVFAPLEAPLRPQ